MLLTIDLDNALVRDRNLQALEALAFGYRSDAAIVINFYRGGSFIEPTSVGLIFTIKTKGEFEQNPPLVLTTSFAKTGSSETAKWTGTAPIYGSAIAAALVVDGDATNDIASFDAMAEVSYQIDGAIKPTRLAWLPSTIRNSLYAGTESTPALPAPNAQSPSFLPGVTGLTGGTETDLDGQPTAGVAAPRLYEIAVEDVWYAYLLREKTDDDVVDGAAIIEPVDFDEDTNSKIFAVLGAFSIAGIAGLQAALNTLTTNLAAEATARAAADSTLTTNLASEVTRATAAEGTNATAITAEATTRAAAITTEATARAAADTTLTTNLASEVTRATAAEGTNATAITAEATRATAAEGTNATAITAEATARAAADTTLTANLAAEVARATAAEAAIHASSHVTYLSQLLATQGTADLENATTFGSDYTSAIQSVLDTASITSPLTLVVDGRYSVTGLSVRSYTSIVGQPGCGFLLRDAIDKPVISNYTLTAGGGNSSQRDKFISISGITINGNSATQSHDTLTQGWIVGLRMMGVENVTIHDLRILNSKTFAAQFANWKSVKMYNVTASSSSLNGDGYKFNGPGQYLDVDSLDAATADDAFSLCPNDITYQSGAVIGVYGPYAGAGDISDVTVRGVTLRTGNGFRLLTSANRLDRVKISNVRGSVTSAMGTIDAFTDPAAMGPVGWGNFGTIEVSDVQVSLNDQLYLPGMFHVGGRVERLIFRDCMRGNGILNNATIKLKNAAVSQLEIDGYRAIDDAPLYSYPHILVENSHVDRILVSRARTERFGAPSTSPLIYLYTKSSVGSLSIKDAWVRGQKNILVIDSTSSLGSLFTDGIVHEGSGGYAAFSNLSTSNVNQTHVSGFSGYSLYDEAAGGTFGTKTGDANTSFQLLPANSFLANSTFIASNGTGIASYTPLTGANFVASAGTWQIQSNQAVPTGSTPGGGLFIATQDVGVSDNLAIDVSVTMSNSATAVGVVYRYVDNSNFDIVTFSPTNGIECNKVIAGAYTSLGSAGTIPSSLRTAGLPYVASIYVSGNKVRVLLHGTSAITTFTGTSANTGTKVGIVSGATSPTSGAVQSLKVQGLW